MFCMFGHETFAFIAWVEIECWMTTMEPPIKRHQSFEDFDSGNWQDIFQLWYFCRWDGDSLATEDLLMGIDLKFLVTEKSSVLSAGAFLPRLLSGRDFVDSTVGYAFLSSLCEVSRSGTLEFLLQARRVQTWTCDPKENISMKVPIRNTFLPCGDICRCVFRQKNFEKSFGTARLEGPITLHFFLFHLRQKSPGPKQVPSTCVVPPTTWWRIAQRPWHMNLDITLVWHMTPEVVRTLQRNYCTPPKKKLTYR